ncbi:MAG: hypothetical protein AAGA33_05605 [Pseudomonadota bacterium]
MNHIPVTGQLAGTQIGGEALLNSELIRERFGSYHVDVLRRTGDTRVSALSSEDGGLRVCRTFAVTQFMPGHTRIDAQVLQQIEDGGSIGATLRRAGIEVDKQSLEISEVSLDVDGHPALERMRIDAPAVLAQHIYTLGIRGDSDASPFAIIAELHHPDFLTGLRLNELFELSPERSRVAFSLESLRAEVFQTAT